MDTHSKSKDIFYGHNSGMHMSVCDFYGKSPAMRQSKQNALTIHKGIHEKTKFLQRTTDMGSSKKGEIQCGYIYIYIHTEVSINYCTPKSSIFIRLSLINHPYWGTPIYGNPHMYIYIYIHIYTYNIDICVPCRNQTWQWNILEMDMIWQWQKLHEFVR